MKRILSTVAAIALFSAPAFGQIEPEMSAQLIWSAPLGVSTPSQRGITPGATYSNVVNFGGSGLGSIAGLQGSNGVTGIIMDDIQFDPLTAPGGDIQQVTFCVANFNATTTNARVRLRFWADNGADSPSTYYTSGTPATAQGFTFNPIQFASGVSCFFTTFAPSATGFKVPGSLKFWAGMQYDNNNGTTGATLADLANLGVAIFSDAADVGFSNPEEYWNPDAFGNAFPTNAGTAPVTGLVDTLGYPGPGAPPANFGWEFVSPTIPEPMTIGLLGLGAAALIRRRR